MVNNDITIEEFNQFKSLSFEKKVDSMELYLIGDDRYKRYNMQMVGLRVFGDENYSFTVSLIHRCYNFSGQNGGKYRNGCKFEQATGYCVTRSDIEAFIKKYPNGTFNNGVTFEDFLITRIRSKGSQYNTSSVPQYARSSAPIRQSVSQQNTDPFNQQYNYYPQNYGKNRISTERSKMLMTGLGCIGILILLVLLISGGLFRYWIISLIILFLTVGAFASRT